MKKNIWKKSKIFDNTSAWRYDVLGLVGPISKFYPKKRKTGNSAKFRPDSQKRTSDSDSATKN